MAKSKSHQWMGAIRSPSSAIKQTHGWGCNDKELWSVRGLMEASPLFLSPLLTSARKLSWGKHPQFSLHCCTWTWWALSQIKPLILQSGELRVVPSTNYRWYLFYARMGKAPKATKPFDNEKNDPNSSYLLLFLSLGSTTTAVNV